MPTTVVNGCAVRYEEMGSGRSVVLNPGGRGGITMARPIAELIAPHYRVLIYDRRNSGGSEFSIAGEGSEQDILADDLAELIGQRDMAPAFLAGWSFGGGVSVKMAHKYPKLVRGLLLGSVAGGPRPQAPPEYQRATRLYAQWMEAAEERGMAGVVALPYFQRCIEENPSNRDSLLAMDSEQFIEVMRRWQTLADETSHLPVIGNTEEQIRSIGVPTVIVASNDPLHTLQASQNLHRIMADSEYHDPVFTPEEWDVLWNGPDAARAQALADRTVPIFMDFLRRLETRQPVPGV